MRKTALIPAALCVGLVAVTAAAPSGARDMISDSEELLDQARAHIAAEDWSAAIDVLENQALRQTPNDADAHNLLGFALRNSGELAAAERAYVRALELDPDHLGALEYQGELFVILGEIDAAEANLARLALLCDACEEHEDLAEAIAAAAEQGE